MCVRIFDELQTSINIRHFSENERHETAQIEQSTRTLCRFAHFWIFIMAFASLLLCFCTHS